MQLSSEDSSKLKALKLSAIAITSVVIVEVALGIFVNSLAILSDGLHALLDALTSVMLFIATKAALKPADEEHTYGHEKFEPIGGLIGGIVLLGVGLLVLYEAVLRLLSSGVIASELQFVGFLAVGYTFCIDLIRMFIFRKGTESKSATVKVGFYHTLADLSSTLIAFLGFGLATIGFHQGDSLSSIILGILISFLSLKLAKSSIRELSDTASKEILEKSRTEILSQEGILGCENLRARQVGSKIFVETSVKIPNITSLESAHELASQIESRLIKVFGSVDATIHIEPSETKTQIDQRITRIASVEGVLEVHKISTAYARGKLFITLHACADPSLSVKEAHALAEEIEKRMKAEIDQLENVTVHVEPIPSKVHGVGKNEAELARIIDDAILGYKRYITIKKLVSYEADGKCFINLDCCFKVHVSLQEAHDLASIIESEIRRKFCDGVVTVHIEPDGV